MQDEIYISFNEARGVVSVRGNGDFVYQHLREFPRSWKVKEIIFDGEIYIVTDISHFENLEKIVFPRGTQRIKHSQILDNPSLKEIVLSDSIKVIESCAFYRCPQISEINISPFVEIQDEAFDKDSPIAKRLEREAEQKRLAKIAMFEADVKKLREILNTRTVKEIVSFYLTILAAPDFYSQRHRVQAGEYPKDKKELIEELISTVQANVELRKPIEKLLKSTVHNNQEVDLDSITIEEILNAGTYYANSELMKKIKSTLAKGPVIKDVKADLIRAKESLQSQKSNVAMMGDVEAVLLLEDDIKRINDALKTDDETLMRETLLSVGGLSWDKLEEQNNSELQEKLDKLNAEKKQVDEEVSGVDSKLSELKAASQRVESYLTESTNLLRKINTAKNEWNGDASLLFRKAALANAVIELHPDGYSIMKTTDKGGLRPATSVGGSFKIDIDFQPEILEDLKKRCDNLLPLWKAYVDANNAFWAFVNTLELSVPKENLTDANKVLSSIEAEQSRITSKGNEVIKQKADSTGRLNEIDSRIAEIESELRIQEEQKQKLSNLADAMAYSDPVLAGFVIPKELDTDIYDNAWIDLVKNSAQTRKNRKFLPLTPWVDKPGVVYSWDNAIKEGKPHFIIDSFHEESEQERRDMLDVFVATMLLSFPIKKVHFNVIERHAVNPFVANLPEKISHVYDLKRDSNDIKDLVWRLKEMTRNGRYSQVEPCVSREIVVFAGYDRNDHDFDALMDDLRDVIIDGPQAGIYFALLLTDDFEDYNEGKDIKNLEYFERYATLLTDELANDGYIPDYNLLRRKAKVQRQDRTEDSTLGELISAYVQKESTATPNGVYKGLETGTSYSGVAINNLSNQSANNIDNLVFPIAQTEDGEEIEMRLNSTDYISYFILGRSGMGKSYTLHTILTNLMLKYDSSVVDLILMDFKPGGVEMNYYKDIPHVSKLLVNGADRQVAKEILMSIIKEMEHRGELFQKYDVSSIRKYNDYATAHSLPQMKHIILLVDECQDLFKIENPGSDTNIVTEIARKGRSYGIHMILATQTLQGTDIPGDALAQFSDFLFMGCKDSDVEKCEIRDSEVIKAVNKLTKGEVIYCHRAAQPIHGYVYNYSGKNGIYRDKTRECLMSDKFTKAETPQFYFNASQIYSLDENQLSQLKEVSLSGLKPVPMAVLGKNLSVKGDTLYSRFRKSEGGNLLIMGTNELLQSERVLWNAVLSLYSSHKSISTNARFFILPNFPEDVTAEAKEYDALRNGVVRNLNYLPGVELVDEDDCASIIERVAATVRHRSIKAESDRKAIDALDSIYLVIPNQYLYYTKMAKPTKGEKSLDETFEDITGVIDTAPTSAYKEPEPEEKEINTDDLEFGSIDFDAFYRTADPEPEQGLVGQGASPFDKIDMDDAQPIVNTPRPTTASSVQDYNRRKGRNLGEELRQIMQNGPAVKVHVLLQTTSPDKVFSDDPLRRGEMGLFFNDMIFLRMAQTNGLPIPDSRDCAQIEKLSADPKSLRAIVYNAERGIRTMVPFDFPNTDINSLVNN